MPGIKEASEELQLELQGLAANVVSTQAAYVQAEHARRTLIFAVRRYQLEVATRNEKYEEAKLAMDSRMEACLKPSRQYGYNEHCDLMNGRTIGPIPPPHALPFVVSSMVRM